MDRSEVQRTHRRINGRTQIAMDQTEVLQRIDGVDIQLFGLSDDLEVLTGDVAALSNDLAPRILTVEADVDSLSNAVAANTGAIASYDDTFTSALILANGLVVEDPLTLFFQTWLGEPVDDSGFNLIDVIQRVVDYNQSTLSNVTFSNIQTTTIDIFEDHGLTIAGVNFIDIINSIPPPYELPSNISINQLTVYE